MHVEFEMSMMGELNFFLGLQIKQMEDGIFFNESKYIKEMLKKFGLDDSKPTKTPMSTEIKLTKDDESNSVNSTKYQGTGRETIVYADFDHVGDYVDRKRTSGVCTLTRYFLTSWLSKKQMALAIFTTEAKYVSTGKNTKIKEHHHHLSPPHAPSKSASSRSTYQTTSSSPSESSTPTHVAPLPKLRFVIPMKFEPQQLPPQHLSPHDPYALTMDNWPPGPSNLSSPPRVSHPPPGFAHPPLGFKHPPPP
nr:copia protein [Tanacetum cinerariifolium]